MRRLWRWAFEVSIGGAMMLLGRWALRVGKPLDDLEAMRRVAGQLVERARSAWSILWRAYGPVTADMRARWEQLRARYRGGSYDVEGT